MSTSGDSEPSRRAMSKNKKAFIVFCLIVLALGTVGLVPGIYERYRLSLPSDIVTLDGFSTRMPVPKKVIAFEKNGSTYLEVIGQPPRPFTFPIPSGPPAYVFDSTGHISYWTIDVGDSPRYWNDWQNRSNSREVSMSEALRMVKR